jgi:hypothetical protein
MPDRISGMEMALHAIVTDINTVPEALRTEYTEKDGKFFLNVEPVDGFKLENVDGLVNALSAERTLKDRAEAALKQFKDIDPKTARSAIEAITAYGDLTPQQVQALQEEVANLRAIDPTKEAGKLAEAQVSAAVAAAKAEAERVFGTEKTTLAEQLNGLTALNEGLKGQLKDLLVGNQVKAEIARLKVVPGLEPAAEMLASQSIRTVEKDNAFQVVVIDKDGNPRMKLGENNSLVPFTVTDLMDELKKTTPGLFQAEDKGGVGIQPGRHAPGTGGISNPWSKEAWNQTEQAKLRLSNPTLAAQLKAQAGVS